MNSGLEGQVVWITGASGGIGKALAKEFASEGSKLVLQAGKNLSELETWVREEGIAEFTFCSSGDVRDSESIQRVIDEGASKFGKIDICIANAGIWPTDDVPLHKLDIERIRNVLDVNLFGLILTARAFFRHLDRSPGREGSSLCLVGSTAGNFGERGHTEYAASKAALSGVLRTLKNEIVRLDPFGRVNLVEPGWTATSMAEDAMSNDATLRRALATMSLRQIARPEDVARATVFLSAPFLSRHITGQTITVAGGMEGRVQWDENEIVLESVLSRLKGDG